MWKLATALCLLAATAAQAQNRPEWWPVPGLNSAIIMQDNWELVSSSGLSWPDGRQAIMTFWRKAPGDSPRLKVVRCMDFFDDKFRSTAGICHAVVTPGQKDPKEE